MIYFDSDYMAGAHPEVLKRLVETNTEQTVGYGCDDYTKRAVELIREACGLPEARVQLLVGGTQTNATLIDALLARHEGVLAAETGHIAVHEAGAVVQEAYYEKSKWIVCWITVYYCRFTLCLYGIGYF